MTSTGISFGARIGAIAARRPDDTAVTFVRHDGRASQLTWGELAARSNQVARLLGDTGAGPQRTVAIGLDNSLEHMIAALAAWKVGACALPFNPEWDAAFRDPVLEPAEPIAVIAEAHEERTDVIGRGALLAAGDRSRDDFPGQIACPGKAIPTGGSTGRPKVLVDPSPWAWAPDALARTLRLRLGMRPRQRQLVAGPLYLNAPFLWAHYGLCDEHELVVMERFDAESAVDLIQGLHISFAWLSPTMMRAIVRTPGVTAADLASIEAVVHTGGPCPEWVKRAFLDLVGPAHLFEAYGATEGVGMTAIRGDEWLDHPRSVGRPLDTEIVVRDARGADLAVGEVGEIFMRWADGVAGPVHHYLGAPPPARADGTVSVGDLGWLDVDGFLYIADRVSDVIASDAGPIYPIEVEAVLTRRADVSDAAVVARRDRGGGGTSVHAVIEPADGLAPPPPDELRRHCAHWLAGYKVPAAYEFVERLPRQASGKLNRSALAGGAGS